MPWRFDAERMAREVEALPGDAWMPHPSAMGGNTAVALISRKGGDNHDFDGPMTVTPHLERCPAIRRAMASLGEVLGRSRLMRLAPGCEVSLHVDFNYHWVSRVRMHIPLITNPNVKFFCGNEAVHMRAGESWLFDSWRRHRVVNAGDADRTHLVLDTSGSARFWAAVRSAETDPELEPEPLGFGEEAGGEIETERYNTAPVMAPGELDGLVAELVAEFMAHPGNDPALVAEYRDLLFGFSRDWRAAWHRYGFRKEGWPYYRGLIEDVQSRLLPDPTALLTCSNEIGVNPVIVQRILRPALAEAHFDQVIGEAASIP